MDLESVARTMRVDVATLAVTRALADAGIPHVLIKGPTTAMWLYEPPRAYVDVDVLVPFARLDDVVAALEVAGVANPAAGELGEEASHSLLLQAASGVEVDVHVTLPSMEIRQGEAGRQLWQTLSGHIEDFDLYGSCVPAFDIQARCLVLALHALGGARESQRVREDLRRARAAATVAQVGDAVSLAQELGVEREFAAGWNFESAGVDSQLPLDLRLLMAGASGSAVQLARLRRAPLKLLPGLLIREAFPTPGFMRRVDPASARSTTALVLAYARRLVRLARALPIALAQTLRASSDHRER